MKGNNARKRPFPSGWQKNNNYKFDDQPFLDWISDDNNFGVLCGKGNLAVIDADEPEISELVQKKLPKTFTVTTGSGGKHFYFIVPDMERKIVLYDKDHKHYGEIQFTGTQVIAPGSIHPNNKRYEISRDLPIKTISLKDIEKTLSDYVNNTKNLEEWEFEEIDVGEKSEFIDITKIINISGFKKHGREYYGAHPVHGSSTGTNFVVNPIQGTWYCFRCNSGGGALSLIAVLEGIIDCSEAKPGALKGDVFKQLVNVAQEKYDIKINNTPNIANNPNLPNLPNNPNITDKEYLLKRLLSKKKRPYQNIGRGINNGICYIATYVEDEDGRTHTAVVTSDRQMYIDLSTPKKDKNEIRSVFDLYYREEFNWEIIENAWTNEIIKKWLFEDYKVDIKDIYQRLLDVEKKFMIYEDPRIYSCIVVDILRSYFFFLFGANSRTHLWAEKGSGKTNQCNLFRALMFHPIGSPDFSSASIYRTIEATGATIIVDDFDDLGDDEKKRLNRHIKVNYKPFKSVRSDGGGKFRPQGYDAYSHCVFNNTYGIDDEITKDRVNTFKLLRHKDAPFIEVDHKSNKFAPLRDDLYICLLQYWEQVQEIFKKLKIPDLKARNLENWKPQLAIAKAIDQSVFEDILSYAKDDIEQNKLKDLDDDWEFLMYDAIVDKVMEEQNPHAEIEVSPTDIAKSIVSKLYFELPVKDKEKKLNQVRSFIGGKLSTHGKFRKIRPHNRVFYLVTKEKMISVLDANDLLKVFEKRLGGLGVLPWLAEKEERERVTFRENSTDQKKDLCDFTKFVLNKIDGNNILKDSFSWDDEVNDFVKNELGKEDPTKWINKQVDLGILHEPVLGNLQFLKIPELPEGDY